MEWDDDLQRKSHERPLHVTCMCPISEFDTCLHFAVQTLGLMDPRDTQGHPASQPALNSGHLTASTVGICT